MRKPGFLRNSIVSVITFVFTLSHFCPYAVSAEQQKLIGCGGCTYEEARENMAIFFRQLKKLRAAFDETDFNPEAKAKAIGPEIEDLYRFVRDGIAYQPYHGALRLAQGTLMSRAGNSYDQSLLLGAMLRAHGHKVRYARKQLTGSQAQKLIAVTDQPHPFNLFPQSQQSSDPLDAVITANEDIGEIQTLNEALIDLFLVELLLEFDVDYALLANQLASAGIFLKQPTKDLLPQIKDHCWVQVQSNGSWLDLDPSLPTLDVGQCLAGSGSVSESLSADDVAYKLKFAMFIEQTEGEKKQTKTVLEHVANLTRTINDISVVIVPEIAGGSASRAFSDPNFIRTFEIVYPGVRVNGNVFPGQPFDLEGDIVSTDPRIRQAEKLRKPVKKGYDTTTNILDGIFGGKQAKEKKAPKTPKLTKVWLTVSLIRPDGKIKTIERGLAKRLRGSKITDEAADLDLRRQFLGSFDILASGSGMTEGYLQSHYLDHYLTNRSAFFMLLNQEYGKRVPNQRQILDYRLRPYPFELLKFLDIRRSIMEFNATENFPGLSAFTAEPQVVAFRRNLTASQDGEAVLQKRFDIMFNTVEAFELLASDGPNSYPIELLQGDALTDRSAEFRFQQGIVDTLIEYFMLGGGEAINAHSVLAKAVETGIALELVKPNDKAALNKLDIDEGTRIALARDLDQGFAVFAPVGAVIVGTNPAFAWWRIHPATGETLGLAGSGEGQTATEYWQATKVAFGSSLALCGLMQAFLSPEQSMAEHAWDYAKCVVIGTALGPAGAWGTPRLGIAGFNAAICVVIVAMSQMDMPPGGVRGSARVGRIAEDWLTCFAIGSVLSFGGMKYRNYRWPKKTVSEREWMQTYRRAADARRDAITRRIRDAKQAVDRGRPVPEGLGRPPLTEPPAPRPTNPPETPWLPEWLKNRLPPWLNSPIGRGNRPTTTSGAPSGTPGLPGGGPPAPPAQPPGLMPPPPGPPRPLPKLPTPPAGRPTAQPPSSIPPPPGQPRSLPKLPTPPAGRPTAQPPSSIPPPPGQPRPLPKLPTRPGGQPKVPPSGNTGENLRQAVENGRKAAENLNRFTQEALGKTNQLAGRPAQKSLADNGRKALEDIKRAAEQVRRLTRQAERGAGEVQRRAQTITGQQGARPPR